MFERFYFCQTEITRAMLLIAYNGILLATVTARGKHS